MPTCFGVIFTLAVRRGFRVIGTAALLVSVACGSTSAPTAPTATTPVPEPAPTPTPTPTPVSQTVVVSNPIPPSGYDLGRTYQLRATLRAQGQQDRDITTDAQWSSSNAGVASVSGGALTIRGLGEVDIAAAYQNVAGMFHVSVSAGQVTFEVDAGVPQSDQDIIRSGIDLAQSYFLSAFSWTPTRPVTVSVRAGANGGISAQVINGQIIVHNGSPDWQRATPDLKRKTMVHEFFHIMQGFIGWTSQAGNPLWLLEGTAEYVGFRAAILDRGIHSADQMRGCQQYNVANSSVRIPPLAELEGQPFYNVGNQGAPVYGIAYLAAERAVQDSGLQSLTTFGLSTVGSPWQNAFQLAFGLPIGTFYEQLEQYRGSWRPPASYTCLR